MNTFEILSHPGQALKLAALVLATAAVFAGCDTMPTAPVAPAETQMDQPHSEAIILREGDTVKVSFPGSPSLDKTQPIRRDGKLNLPLIGEVDAAGLSPTALQDKLLKAYASQISTKEVVVEVEASSFPVFVSGAVVHPGKILSNHPIDALEAVMEAGGFIYGTADMKRVRVNRSVDGVRKSFIINLKDVLTGKPTKPFYLKPNDIIYVPEQFSPF